MAIFMPACIKSAQKDWLLGGMRPTDQSMHQCLAACMSDRSLQKGTSVAFVTALLAVAEHTMCMLFSTLHVHPHCQVISDCASTAADNLTPIYSCRTSSLA